jgi:hypothetical protein
MVMALKDVDKRSESDGAAILVLMEVELGGEGPKDILPRGLVRQVRLLQTTVRSGGRQQRTVKSAGLQSA